MPGDYIDSSTLNKILCYRYLLYSFLMTENRSISHRATSAPQDDAILVLCSVVLQCPYHFPAQKAITMR
jgi:hypothetical protein